MLNLNHFGRAVARAMSPEPKLFRNVLAIQKRNQCKHEDDNATANKSYDAEDSQFTDQELNLFKKLFMRYDRDENCKLDRWEFNQFAKFLVGRSYNSIDLEKVFTRYDSQKDGYVDFPELITYLSRRFRPQSMKRVAVAFNMFDKNNDAMLEFWEAKQALFYLGENIIAKCLRYEFDLEDDDQDGKLIFDQFADFICALRKKPPQICKKKVDCGEKAPECPPAMKGVYKG